MIVLLFDSLLIDNEKLEKITEIIKTIKVKQWKL